jgi:hypothetical protein
VDLHEDNIEAWEFISMFPGVLSANGMSPVLRVDYHSVQGLAAAAGIEDWAALIVKLEAIARGYNNKQRQA